MTESKLFPADFMSCLTSEALAQFERSYEPFPFNVRETVFRTDWHLPKAIKPEYLERWHRWLEEDIKPYLGRDIKYPDASYRDHASGENFPSGSRSFNWNRLLPNGSEFNTKTIIGDVCRRAGYLDFCRSESLPRFLFGITGLESALTPRERSTNSQISYYQPGDYLSLHADYVTMAGTRFSNSKFPIMTLAVSINLWSNVAHHYLNQQQDPKGLLTHMQNMCEPGTEGDIYISLYPKLHQVLPLTPLDSSQPSHRWLLMNETRLSRRQIAELIRYNIGHWQIKSLIQHLTEKKLIELLTEYENAEYATAQLE